jgi:hypothetical protein
MYKNEIGNEPWYIYFDGNAIVVGSDELLSHRGSDR